MNSSISNNTTSNTFNVKNIQNMDVTKKSATIPTTTSATTKIAKQYGKDDNSDSNIGLNGSRGHVVLVLDEKLQQLPFECMPCLRETNCSRVPGFALLLKMIRAKMMVKQNNQNIIHSQYQNGNSKNNSCSLKKNEGASDGKRSNVTQAQIIKGVEMTNEYKGRELMTQHIPSNQQLIKNKNLCLNKCWYVIDPENNLPLTRQKMGDFIIPHAKKYQWKGFIGEFPELHSVRCVYTYIYIYIYIYI
jgi:hypothetical protein